MRPEGIRYLVSYHPEMCGLPAETAGILDVVNTFTGNVFWFDNDNMEWHKSIYSAQSTIKEIGTEYEEVDCFDNGYINTDDLWDEGSGTSLLRRYPDEFIKNFETFHEKDF